MEPAKDSVAHPPCFVPVLLMTQKTGLCSSSIVDCIERLGFFRHGFQCAERCQLHDAERASSFVSEGPVRVRCRGVSYHWYYDRYSLKETYGEFSGYVKPAMKLRGSIMSLSNTRGRVRGSDKGNIMGDVILHGKKKYWKRSRFPLPRDA